MFKEMEIEQLPAMTEILITISNFAAKFWYSPIVLFFLIIFVFKTLLSSKGGRKMIHSIVYHLPVFGDLTSRVAVARFSRTLGTLINSGVPILEALTITRSTVGNAVVESALDLVHDNLKEGESMVAPLTEANIFPPMVISMVSVGEETGRISEMLIKIAETYDDEVDNSISGLTSLIEPVMIVTLAGIVAFIVIAMFYPLIGIIEKFAA